MLVVAECVRNGTAVASDVEDVVTIGSRYTEAIAANKGTGLVGGPESYCHIIGDYPIDADAARIHSVNVRIINFGACRAIKGATGGGNGVGDGWLVGWLVGRLVGWLVGCIPRGVSIPRRNCELLLPSPFPNLGGFE